MGRVAERSAKRGAIVQSEALPSVGTRLVWASGDGERGYRDCRDYGVRRTVVCVCFDCSRERYSSRFTWLWGTAGVKGADVFCPQAGSDLDFSWRLPLAGAQLTVKPLRSTARISSSDSGWASVFHIRIQFA
jgi:hypothetical protein